ncbi:UNVERIFIED_CONTAM: hypothetical protein FKN15_069582 [Acipenser sinensis]
MMMYSIALKRYSGLRENYHLNQYCDVIAVKLLIVTITRVGKSSLVHLLCHNQVLGNPSWTVGCSVDVRVHDYKEGTPEEKTYYIELWDVGGTVGSGSSVKSTRAVFYNSVNALNKDSSPTGVIVTNGDYDREQFADNQTGIKNVPTGNPCQFTTTKKEHLKSVLTRTAFLAEDFNAEEINLDCTTPRYLAAGSSNAVKLSRFFDKDCTTPRYLAAGSSNAVKLSRFFDKMPGFSERKRYGAGNSKSLHYD